jgi:biopolymer transport protein ExbD
MLRRSLLDDDSQARTEINLTPMIDCIFILLIFFIVTTVFVDETGIEVNKPDAASAVPLEKNSLLLAISADGRVFYAGREIGVDGVGSAIRRQLAREALPVIIQADERAPHGVFAEVYGEAKLAGAPVIHFSTRR